MFYTMVYHLLISNDKVIYKFPFFLEFINSYQVIVYSLLLIANAENLALFK